MISKHPSVQLALVLLTTLGAVPAARAATIVWSGGTGVFGTAANWVGGVAPGPNDTAAFTGSTTACSINAATTVAAINMTNATALTVASGNALSVTGSFTQSAGTFAGGNSMITIGGSLNLTNGTFTSTSGVLKLGGAFNKTGGTFTHSSGRVLLDAASNQTFATNGAAFYDLAINDGLVGYWKLDEGTGTSVADASGYGHTGTLFNTPTWTTGPALLFTNANALALNGTTQYGRVSRTTALESAAITVSAWVKRNGTQVQYTKIVDKTYDNAGTSPYSTYELQINNSGTDSSMVGFQTGTTGPTIDTINSATGALPDGVWTHVVGVYDPSGGTLQKRLYVNGVLSASKTMSSPLVYDTSSTGNLYFGQTGGGTQYLKGSIDEVRIYERALADAEIYSLYMGSQPGTGRAVQSMTGSPTIANDLILASGTLSVGSNNLTVGGSWNNYGGLFIAGTGTVMLTATDAEVIRSAGQPFKSLTLNGVGATWTLEDWLKVNSSLTMTAGALNAGAYAVHASDLNKTSGTFTAGTGTVVIDATSNVTESTGFSFNNLRVETPNESNLVAYWKLDEGQGTTIRDASGTGNNGTLVGSTDWVSASLPALGFDNHAGASFNGTTTYASLGTTSLPANNAPQSIAFWVDFATISADAYIVSLWNPSGSGTSVGLHGSQLQAWAWGPSTLVTLSPPATGSWHHVAYTFDGTTHKLYLDGGTPNTSTLAPNTATPTMAQLAAYNGGPSFNGQLDDVRIYSVALTAAQIQSLAAGRYAGTGSGATVTLGANLAVTGTLAVDNGALATSTFNVNTAGLTLANGSITQGTGAAVALTGAYAQTGGTFTGGTSTFSVGGTSAFSGGTFTAGTGNVTLTGASTVSGGTVTLGAGTDALQSTLAVSGGTLTGGSGPVTVTGAATINGAGTINAGSSSNFKLNGTLAIGSVTSGTFNADSATVSFTGAVTLQDGGAFNGNTGSGTFSAAPTLTNGTFTVADAGSTGRWTFNQSASFSSGVTLAFPTNKGELSLLPGKTLTLNGPVTSNVGTSSTLPKIDCNGCAAGQGITVAFAATSTLDINGLEFDNSVATGVSVANGARYTLFKRLKFLNNVGGVGSTHLLLTLGSAVVNAPGFYFDATAAHNVTLYGAAASPAGAVAIFENQGVATNGSGAGASLDQAGDTNEDNIGDNTSTAPYYGSVIEWVRTSTTDTAGTVVGSPAPAFDWNTFSFYGVYVAFKDTAGAGTADVLWRRNDDGSAAASYSVPQTSGDIVGTPFWDTVNETTAAVDANGNGNQTDTDVRVVYIATTLGHIIKLVDTASGFAAPASGPWKTDFSSPSTVATITSPLIEDQTNLYFGGTNGSGPCIFGVQVAGGANEKTLQRTVPSVSGVMTTPSWSVYGGSTYVFVGSTAITNQAYVYRVNMSVGNVNASYSGVTSNVNGSVILVNNRAYAVTDGGTLHVLDASNFGSGAFKNLTGFPYQNAAGSAIKAAPWVDYRTNYAYFGDDGGNLHVVTSTGPKLTGYPFSISPSIKVSTSPIYHAASGVIAVGANDGYLYFVDRHNASNVPQVFKRYVITSSGTVSTVSYDANISSYLVASSDGKLVFISAADVGDPTPGTE